MQLSQVFERQNGQMGYIVDLEIFNNATRTIDVVAVELRTPWKDSLFQWLAPTEIKSLPRAKKPFRYKTYQFPGETGQEFEPKLVLHQRLFEKKTLPGKRLQRGLLLGIGGRMPSDLRDGDCLEVPLVIAAADGAEYATTLDLYIERLPAQSKPKTDKVRKSIFAHAQKDSTPEQNAPETSQPGRPSPQPKPAVQPSADVSPNLGDHSSEVQELSKTMTKVMMDVLAECTTWPLELYKKPSPAPDHSSQGVASLGEK